MAAGMTVRVIGRAKRWLSALDREARYVLLARLLQSGNGFLLSIILVQVYGLAAAGTFAVAGVLIAPLAILATFGLPFSLARSHAPVEERNALGCTAGLLAVPLGLPAIAACAALLGRDGDEAMAIAWFACGGLFFAQVNVFNALLVLQRRAALSVLPHLYSSAGILLAALLADGLLDFAMIVGIQRIIGVFLCFLLPHSRIDLRAFFRHARESAHFMPFELIHLGADQLFTVALSYLLTREQLGIFGLWRQVFNAGMLAPSSMLQTAYPEIVRDPQGSLPTLRRKLNTVSLPTTIGIALLSWPLGLLVYNAPYFPVFTLLLMACLPLGCLVVLYDSGLRALGEIRLMNQLGLARGAILLSVVPFLHFGLPGLAAGVNLYTALCAWLTLRAFAQASGRQPVLHASSS
ncbi:lipopolysaccharide biosynthesis protein [Azospirillum sp.]|uniref:lipopolysaccharide biosynthesis protein n=1 Tax=Azospirillum sp. TaxID=34012 RepID=UPI003D745273